jgi:vancomycin permeability regulator SanA
LAIAFIAADLLVSTVIWLSSPALVTKWDETCQSSTALVIFFGGENSHTRSRVNEAADALKACPALRAFLVGGARPDRGYFGSDEMKGMLVDAGVAKNRLASERISFHSFGNIDAMFELAGTGDIEELVLVSDPLHISRLAHDASGHVSFARYRFSGLVAWPAEDPLAFWWRPHYEAVAWLMQILPATLYDRVIQVFRR